MILPLVYSYAISPNRHYSIDRDLALALERDRLLGLQNIPQISTLWAVNRIVDPELERRVVRLLELHHETYIIIPYDELEYLNIPYDWASVTDLTDIHSDPFGLPLAKNSIPDVIHERSFVMKASVRRRMAVWAKILNKKVRYLLGKNMARDQLRQIAKTNIKSSWVMMMEPDTYLSNSSLESLQGSINSKPNLMKLYVPTVGICLKAPGNTMESLNLSPSFRDSAGTRKWFTPQVLLRSDSTTRFDSNPYHPVSGKQEYIDTRVGTTMELRSILESWDAILDRDPYRIGSRSKLKGIALLHIFSQSKAIQEYVLSIHGGLIRKRGYFNSQRLFYYNERVLLAEKRNYQSGGAAKVRKDKLSNVNLSEHAGIAPTTPIRMTSPPVSRLVETLIRYAEDGMKHGPFSVIWKETLPPSNNKQDYFTPAPYFWPDPTKPDGLPFIRRDGKRVPGTELYDAFSNRYDRSRIASFFGNTTCLALAWFFTDDIKYAVKAADNIRVWFINPETRMNPNVRYAQIQRGSKDDIGASFGVIETRDLFYLLDVVRLVFRSGQLLKNEVDSIKDWLHEFATYLKESSQGKLEYSAVNNHGTFFDVQMAAIAGFLDDELQFLRHTVLARSRMHTHFAPDGSLPHEMERPTQLHYMMFGLMGWLTLGVISENGGVPLWDIRTEGRDLTPDIYRSLKFTVPHFNRSWTHPQNVTENMRRMDVLFHIGSNIYEELAKQEPAPEYSSCCPLYKCQPMFTMHSGIPPFWNLGLVQRKA
eukprot:CFRG5919T1